MSTERRVAVVTGAASGIGLAIAQRLAADGHAVAVFDLNGPAAESAAADIVADGGVAKGYAVDIADRARVESAVAEVRRDLGPVTVLVNNAGITDQQPFTDISFERWQQIMDVNINGTFHCTQVVLADMLAARWGRIVNISSSSAQRGSKNMVAYSASKGAMIVMTRSLALELGAHGITVNNIPPGFIDTPMLRETAASGHLGPNGIEAQIAATPVGRPGRPEDMAAMCAFLVSEEAGYITGQTMGVNGGRVTS